MATITWISEFLVPANDDPSAGDVSFEDNGNRAVLYFVNSTEIGGDGCFFVRLLSWDEGAIASKKHALFRSLMGRRVRVTVETIDDITEKT